MTLLSETLTRTFQKRVAQSGGKIAFKRKVGDIWEEITFQEYRNFVEEICYALIDFGIEPGDRVAILSNTRMEWALADMGILSAQGITVPIYQSSAQSDVEYVLRDSETQLIFVEDASQLKKVLAVASRLPELKHIVVFEERLESLPLKSFMTFTELCQKGRHYRQSHRPNFDEQLQKGTPQDNVTIVYTSGTTGMPKGVVLTHENFMSELEAIAKIVPPLSEKDSTLTFLPYAHIFARTEHYCGFVFGWIATFSESVAKVVENLSETKPTLMFCVPRIYEKVYSRILGQIQVASPLKKKIFYWSLDIGKKVSQRLQNREALPPLLTLKYALAKKLVFNKIKQKFGGKIRFFVSAGAPLSPSIAEFFHAVGFLILEAYGLTETTGAVFANNPNDFEFGTVGCPLDDVQVKIASDGEILVKSKKVFKTYYKKPEATQESFRDGWYCTGDIGFLNERGHLEITDRKKDIIVTSAGKNVAPQKIENLLKTEPTISQVMVYGDKRNYITALITLSQEEIERFATSHGIKYNGNFHEHPEIQKLVETIIDNKNKELASFETIKKFRILKNDFSIETGELTPSMKVKRKFCSEKYKDILNSMYE